MVKVWQFHITAGVLCLDFANTLSWRRSRRPVERLQAVADLASWSRQAGLISKAAERQIARDALAHPRRAAQLLREARLLREAIFEVFAALSEQKQPAAQGMLALQQSIHGALAHSTLLARDGRFAWQANDADSLKTVLRNVALSAEGLLRSDDVDRIGQCAGRDCRWLWIDRTRNQSRRWCDMAVCGNRTKVRRYHQRLLATAG